MIPTETFEQIAENVTRGRGQYSYRRGSNTRTACRIAQWQYPCDALNSAWTVEGLYR